ncbi:DUF1127 domain-containing protein [Coralliovum pocilloporae]
MFTSLYGSYKQWRQYRSTVSQLSQLSGRQLDDLGIIPGDISKIAHRKMK